MKLIKMFQYIKKILMEYLMRDKLVKCKSEGRLNELFKEDTMYFT